MVADMHGHEEGSTSLPHPRHIKFYRKSIGPTVPKWCPNCGISSPGRPKWPKH